MTAIAVTIAGSDSGGGAGIQADLKTFSALGVYGASVITALTAQNTRRRRGDPRCAAGIRDRADRCGLLGSPRRRRQDRDAVAAGDHCRRRGRARSICRRNVVLDPVMVAASGDPLIVDDAVAALVTLLLPRVALITPNLPEAARLLGEPIARLAARQSRARRRGFARRAPTRSCSRAGTAAAAIALTFF